MTRTGDTALYAEPDWGEGLRNIIHILYERL